MMRHKECGNIVLKVLGKLEGSPVGCWGYNRGVDLVYCQQERARHRGQSNFVNQLLFFSGDGKIPLSSYFIAFVHYVMVTFL